MVLFVYKTPLTGLTGLTGLLRAFPQPTLAHAACALLVGLRASRIEPHPSCNTHGGPRKHVIVFYAQHLAILKIARNYMEDTSCFLVLHREMRNRLARAQYNMAFRLGVRAARNVLLQEHIQKRYPCDARNVEKLVRREVKERTVYRHKTHLVRREVKGRIVRDPSTSRRTINTRDGKTSYRRRGEHNTGERDVIGEQT
jgi:hypothetical protein